MVSFSLFCQIEEYLTQYEKQSQDVLHVAGLAEGGTSDDLIFQTLIDQCDAHAIRQLMAQFEPSAPIQKLLKKRLKELQQSGHQSQVNEKSKKTEDSFFLYLLTCIEDKGYSSESDFYNYAGISRQRFGKLRKDDSSISREFALHLAVGLELNYEDSLIFLQKAGYSLKPTSRREAIISYVMRNQEYTFSQMEEILYLFNEKTFLEA